MVLAVPDILARIVSEKQRALPAVQARLDVLAQRAETLRHTRRDFINALCQSPPSVIAEIKKASPSKGILTEDFRPISLARAYEAGGAAALSILTDETFFHGSFADLEAAREAVSVPVLRKDFTIDTAHIVEAAAHGADAILLIAAILSVRELRDFREAAQAWNLAALVEVHNETELDAAIESGADLIGVNNRNLHTFHVDLATSLRLIEKLPALATRVTESGIETAAQVRQLRSAGYHAFLVGEHLVRSGDPTAALQALRS